MAFYYKLEGPAKSAYDKMQTGLEGIARKELKLKDPKSIVTRELRPEDVGLSTPEWTFNVTPAAAWFTMVNNQSISDNRFVGINGIFYPKSTDQAVSQIKITREGQDVRYWPIQGINYQENLAVYFDDPIIVKQNTPITIEGYAVSTGATEKICFLGLVAEKEGLLVQSGRL